MKILHFFLLALFWGGSFIAIKISLEAFSPFFAASARIVVAIIATSIYVLWKKVPFPDRSSSIKMMLNGAIGVGIPWSLLFWGEQYVEPALCSILIAAVPVFTVICAAIFIKSAEDKMTWNKWVGVLIGFAGIVVIFQPFISSDSVQKIEALFAVMGMTIFYAISITWLKKLSKNVENIMALLLSCSGALIVTAPLAIIYGAMNYTFTGAPLLVPSIAILYLALFSTSMGFIIFYKLITEVGTVQASAVGYLIPVVAIVLDLLILKNWIGNHALLGGLIIFAALRLINKPVEKVI